MHIGSTGLSYLVGGCSWQSQADIGTWHCTGPKGVQIVGFLNGTCAGLMWRFRALGLVVQKTLPISPGALEIPPVCPEKKMGRSWQVIPIIALPWRVKMSPRWPPNSNCGLCNCGSHHTTRVCSSLKECVSAWVPAQRCHGL